MIYIVQTDDTLFVSSLGKSKPEEIIFSRVTDLVNRIASGELTSVEVVSTFINRAREVNEELNAIVEWNVNALHEAQQLDDYFKKQGMVKGKLHGIPVTIKEHINVKGMHSTVR